MTVLWVAVGVLAAFAIVEGVAILALAREVALMARRVPETEAVDLSGGPDLGTVLDGLQARYLDGGPWSVGEEGDRPVVLLFVSPHCDPCRKTMQELHRIQADWPDYAVRPIVTGTAEQAALLRREAGPWQGPVLVDTSTAMAELQIPVTPFGLVLDADRRLIARGVVNDRDTAAALIEGRVRATTDADWQVDPQRQLTVIPGPTRK